MNNKLVVGLGEALWDVLPDGKKIGGAPANFAFHVSQFGIPSCAVSAVGDDALGDELLQNFSQVGLNVLMPKVEQPTGTVQVTLDDAGIPQYEITEQVAWDNIPFTPELAELAARTTAVCFGSLAQRNESSRRTIRRFIEAMPRTEDTLVVFDINLRQHFYSPELVRESIELCNILKINDEELEIVARMFGDEALSTEDFCRKLLKDYNLRMLILTCGTSGSYVFSDTETSFRPTPLVEVADTVGAGDSFTGAFIASLLNGRSLQQAHETAVNTSAYVCTQHGAMPQLPAKLKS